MMRVTENRNVYFIYFLCPAPGYCVYTCTAVLFMTTAGNIYIVIVLPTTCCRPTVHCSVLYICYLTCILCITGITYLFIFHVSV
jgi:hypothetical protein